MAAQGVHRITYEFEKAVADYTGAPWCVAVDNCCNALALCLGWQRVKGKEIVIPARTYPGVASEICLAGARCRFIPSTGPNLTGPYQLIPTCIWDCALRFTADMYVPGQLQCLSFTGPYKILKLGKGGAILTDNDEAYQWFKRARNSGRGECSYHDDEFHMLGRNCYMMPEIGARGLQMMVGFYNADGSKKQMADLSLPYPDLSRFKVYSLPA